MTERVPEPTWLMARVDQLLAKYEETGGPTVAQQSEADLVMMLLTEPPNGSTPDEIERWERTCDNCGIFCPPGAGFFTGSVTRDVKGRQVVVTVGVCPDCAAL